MLGKELDCGESNALIVICTLFLIFPNRDATQLTMIHDAKKSERDRSLTAWGTPLRRVVKMSFQF